MNLLTTTVPACDAAHIRCDCCEHSPSPPSCPGHSPSTHLLHEQGLGLVELHDVHVGLHQAVLGALEDLVALRKAVHARHLQQGGRRQGLRWLVHVCGMCGTGCGRLRICMRCKALSPSPAAFSCATAEPTAQRTWPHAASRPQPAAAPKPMPAPHLLAGRAASDDVHVARARDAPCGVGAQHEAVQRLRRSLLQVLQQHPAAGLVGVAAGRGRRAGADEGNKQLCAAAGAC